MYIIVLYIIKNQCKYCISVTKVSEAFKVKIKIFKMLKTIFHKSQQYLFQ